MPLTKRVKHEELAKSEGKSDKLVLTFDRTTLGLKTDHETYMADPKDLCKCDRAKMKPCARKTDNTPDFQCEEPEGGNCLPGKTLHKKMENQVKKEHEDFMSSLEVKNAGGYKAGDTDKLNTKSWSINQTKEHDDKIAEDIIGHTPRPNLRGATYKPDDGPRYAPWLRSLLGKD